MARDYILETGHGDQFNHRVGQSLGKEVHGNAVNLDGFEIHDTRDLIPGIGVAIEFRIYLPEFGMRSEINIYLSHQGRKSPHRFNVQCV